MRIADERSYLDLGFPQRAVVSRLRSRAPSRRSQRQLVLHALAYDLRERADVAEEGQRGLVAFGHGAAQLPIAGCPREVRRHQRQLAADSLAASGAQEPDAHHRLTGIVRVRRERGEAADLAGVVRDEHRAAVSVRRKKLRDAVFRWALRQAAVRPELVPYTGADSSNGGSVFLGRAAVFGLGHQATLPFVGWNCLIISRKRSKT